MKSLTIITIACALIAPALAAHTWEGLDWTVRGIETTAANQMDGSILIQTTGGSSGDPGLDNWVLTAALPKLNSDNPMWMEFSFIDTQAAVNGFGARAYASANHDNGETLIQGGVYHGYADYIKNYSRYEDGSWKPTSWYFDALRSNGEHSFKVGIFDDQSVGIWFDGVLVDRIYQDLNNPTYANLPLNGFTRAYLGMSGPADEVFAVTYTGFTYGYDVIPEPATLVLLGLGGVLCRRFKRA